ncbi:MAG: glycosyltransferase family 39 protein [Lentisphaeria bacterium]|nr:glycosyltransferase family 39 protein [Lentisphaeria bacterium]
MKIFSRVKTWLSFDRPAQLTAVFVGISGLAWVVHTSLLQNILPLDAVEAVVWGNQMQWGQMKSPPLSGWFAAAFWHLSGGGDWALYLLAELTTVIGLWFGYKLAREFMDEYGSATATLLLCFLCYYNPPAMKFCSHDTQIALLPAMTLFFVRALRGDKLKDWLLLALFSALAVLGKYSAVQVLVAYGVVMLGTKLGRRRLASYKPYLCGWVLLALLAPHIVWLFQHDFLSIGHMHERLQEGGLKWYLPFSHLAILLYPYVSCAVVMAVTLPWRKDRLERREVDGTPLPLLLPVALIPPGIYVLLSICGQAVVMQWFSYFAYMAGIIVMLLWPYRCGRGEFKRVFILLNACIVILLVVTAGDVLVKPRLRIHSVPRDIVTAGEDFWRRHSVDGRPLEVVFGDRWLAGVMELYSSSRPSACDGRDVCAWELLRERVRKNGMLIISRDAPVMEVKFLPDVRLEDIRIGKYRHSFRAPFGKSRTRDIWFGYLPPR